MITVKCTYEDGDTVTTGFSGTLEEARAYYVGQVFNLGTVDDHMVRCTAVELVDITFTIDGRTIRATQTDRGYDREPMWDLYEGEELLTKADPLPLAEPPTAELVAHFLHPRVLALVALMAKWGVQQCDDYPDPDEDILAVITAPYETLPGRYAYIHGDETYHFVGTSLTLKQAANDLGSYVGEEYGGNPEGIVDLDTGEEIPFESSIRIVAQPATAGREGMTRRERAVQRIAPLFERYQQASNPRGGEDAETVLADWLSDLMHWAAAEGLDFATAARIAEMHVAAEGDDEEVDDERVDDDADGETDAEEPELYDQVKGWLLAAVGRASNQDDREIVRDAAKDFVDEQDFPSAEWEGGE
jgi:hypothetical protein